MNWLTQWSFDPSIVIGVALAAVLYWRGRRRLSDARRGAPVGRWRVVAFYGGLAVILLALESPIDVLAATLFSFHMIEHLLLIMIAAPLILLGDPGVTIMRGVPLSARRTALGKVGSGRLHSLGAVFGALNRPIPAAVIFLGDLYLWHWGYLFNLTLQNDAIHVFEHVCFLVTGLLLWTQVIDQRALHPRLSYFQRAIYTVIVGGLANLLAMYFVFSTIPLYSYAQVVHRPFGMTALGDQQLAGGIMWVPVLFLFAGSFAVFMYLGLAEDARQVDVVDPGLEAPYNLLPRRTQGSTGGRYV